MRVRRAYSAAAATPFPLSPRLQTSRFPPFSPSSAAAATGPFGCDIDAFNATIHSPPEDSAPNGRPIGWMVVPPFTLKGNGPGIINPTTMVHVTDAAAFNKARLPPPHLARTLRASDAAATRAASPALRWRKACSTATTCRGA